MGPQKDNKRSRRSAGSGRIKESGIHYTPEELADFLATEALALAKGDSLRVLDPACGDGALLEAITRASTGQKLRLYGLDSDPDAIEKAYDRLRHHQGPDVRLELRQTNFVEEIASSLYIPGQLAFGQNVGNLASSFDIVIANPPYVRTQVLGASSAQALARGFGLTGRVDLYHAFVVAMEAALREGGVLSLLCSNRFMTTKSGQDMRNLLAARFSISHLYDLGDTKLFTAAVLPAVVLATKSATGTSRRFPATSIYESTTSHKGEAEYRSVTEALVHQDSGEITVAGKSFSIQKGLIEPSNSGRPWVVASSQDSEFVDRLAASTRLHFRDVGKVRVGIKTTCDMVFVRDDWDRLPTGEQPETEVLRPLLTHHIADRWRASAPRFSVLYPYDLLSESRKPLDLATTPKTSAYLESHRERLASRHYVTEGGRHWWEIWVPQRPALWRHPKLVFPDISEEPRFWLDTTGAVVNGDCYWISLPMSGPHNALGSLMMAIANSTLATRFYDHACGNKLYSGRRRYITQYVDEFPIPDHESAEAAKITRVVSMLLGTEDGQRRSDMEAEIDYLVWRAFGFEEAYG